MKLEAFQISITMMVLYIVHRTQGMQGYRNRRQATYHSSCGFCDNLSSSVRNILMRDEKSKPAMGNRIKELCDTLVPTKLQKSRCYIIGEIIKDPYMLIADVLSPEICFNVPCPSDMKGRVSRQLLRKRYCQFCKETIDKARRNIIFGLVMVKRISRDLNNGCAKATEPKVKRDCGRVHGAVADIDKYIRRHFDSGKLCRTIEFC